MIDTPTLGAELARIGRNPSPIEVGPYSGFRHSAETPAHLFCTVDVSVPELGFLHIVARDSFTPVFLERLIAAFERVKKKRYDSALHVYGAYDLGQFDSLGIAPPSLTKAYENQSAILAQHGFQLFPMHGIEFLNGFSSEQFWTQRRRKDRWNVCILDWHRMVHLSREEPNKAPEPTSGIVTSRAEPRAAPIPPVAHL